MNKEQYLKQKIESLMKSEIQYPAQLLDAFVAIAGNAWEKAEAQFQAVAYSDIKIMNSDITLYAKKDDSKP